MKALTDEESDAMEQKFPCYVHGMLKTESCSRRDPARTQHAASSRSTCPAERRPEQSRLEVRYSPTLAGAMVDALPYLVDYPYGCTEQTLNRFLPTVITQKILLDMKLDLKDIQEKRTNLNAQEIGDDAERAKQWKRFDRNPVFDEDEVRTHGQGRRRAADRDAAAPTAAGAGSPAGASIPTPHTTAVRGPRPADRQAERRGPGARRAGTRRRVAEALPGRAGRNCSRTPRSRTSPKPRWKEHADNLDAFVYMVLVDAGVEERRDARVPLPRPHQAGRLRQGHVRHRPARSRARRRSWP